MLLLKTGAALALVGLMAFDMVGERLGSAPLGFGGPRRRRGVLLRLGGGAAAMFFVTAAAVVIRLGKGRTGGHSQDSGRYQQMAHRILPTKDGSLNNRYAPVPVPFRTVIPMVGT